ESAIFLKYLAIKQHLRCLRYAADHLDAMPAHYLETLIQRACPERTGEYHVSAGTARLTPHCAQHLHTGEIQMIEIREHLRLQPPCALQERSSPACTYLEHVDRRKVTDQLDDL